jgi:hypothetical protein
LQNAEFFVLSSDKKRRIKRGFVDKCFTFELIIDKLSAKI